MPQFLHDLDRRLGALAAADRPHPNNRFPAEVYASSLIHSPVVEVVGYLPTLENWSYERIPLAKEQEAISR